MLSVLSQHRQHQSVVRLMLSKFSGGNVSCSHRCRHYQSNSNPLEFALPQQQQSKRKVPLFGTQRAKMAIAFHQVGKICSIAQTRKFYAVKVQQTSQIVKSPQGSLSAKLWYSIPSKPTKNSFAPCVPPSRKFSEQGWVQIEMRVSDYFAPQIALHFHSYLRPHFPTKLTHRTRKKRISAFRGHRGYAVSMFCLCPIFNQNHRKHYARTAQNSRPQAISEFCRQSGNNYIAIALQRVGQGCPLRTFPFALWTWTKRTPKGSSY